VTQKARKRGPSSSSGPFELYAARATLPDRSIIRTAGAEREQKRSSQSDRSRGERRAGQQETGRKRIVDGDTLRDAEGVQHAGHRPHAGDGSTRP
jgi:hypothetical protein